MLARHSFLSSFSTAVLVLVAVSFAGTLSARPRLATGDDAENQL